MATYGNQSYPDQGYQNPNQGYQNPNQGYPNQGYPNQGYQQNPDQGYPNQGYGATTNLADNEAEEMYQVWEAHKRRGFVSKVFTIVGCQLAFTAVGIAIMQMATRGWRTDTWSGEPDTKGIFENLGLMFGIQVVSLIGFISLLCFVFCNPGALRSSPCNYIVLGLFTLFETGLVSVACAFFTLSSVFSIALLTGLIVLALGLYATYTDTDFTGCGPYLFAAVMCLFLCSLVLSIFHWAGLFGSGEIQWLRILLLCLCVMISSLYIVFDIQLIMGGQNRKFQLSEDDYIIGALMLYADIMSLFLYLLQLFGERR